MKRERKTYEYQCDSCQFHDLASGEDLPRGWAEKKESGARDFYGRVRVSHLCPECATKDASKA
jgi:predicted RNA-binding Zn-ribbon protein involved in translation (DUF1610 family)